MLSAMSACLFNRIVNVLKFSPKRPGSNLNHEKIGSFLELADVHDIIGYKVHTKLVV